jgi:hypothetical protein
MGCCGRSGTLVDEIGLQLVLHHFFGIAESEEEDITSCSEASSDSDSGSDLDDFIDGDRAAFLGGAYASRGIVLHDRGAPEWLKNALGGEPPLPEEMDVPGAMSWKQRIAALVLMMWMDGEEIEEGSHEKGLSVGENEKWSVNPEKVWVSGSQECVVPFSQ